MSGIHIRAPARAASRCCIPPAPHLRLALNHEIPTGAMATLPVSLNPVSKKAKRVFAVGMGLAAHPPAQIPASGATAPGSCLASDAQTLFRIGMEDPGFGETRIREAPGVAPLPAAALAPSLERLQPEHHHVVAEGPQSPGVARDGVVGEVPRDHRPEPGPGLCDRTVPPPHQFDLQRLELGSHPLRDRVTVDLELPLKGLDTDVGEPQKGERTARCCPSPTWTAEAP